MLADAIKGRIPLISVVTDDIVNAEEVLQSIAIGKKVVDFSNLGEKSPVMSNMVYWTFKDTDVTLSNYLRLQKALSCLVVINPTKANSLLFDAGMLPVPESMLSAMLKPFTTVELRVKLIQVLKGLSLKTAGDIVHLTSARTGGMLPAEVRKTRLSLTGGVRGLIPLETEEQLFYAWPPEVKEWLETNRKYFENENTPHKLLPRGLMLAGSAGTGKTMAAREVAHQLGIPLYRLDVPQALTRYIGEAENQIARMLAMADQEAPCLLLLDEVEKIFTHSDDSGTISRILSQLLWWLNEHQSRVLTIMTTNKLEKIPPELYRPGRLDMVVHLPKLGLQAAKQFCLEVFKDVTGHPAPMGVQHKLREAIEETGKGELAHSEISQLVYNLIKTNSWLKI